MFVYVQWDEICRGKVGVMCRCDPQRYVQCVCSPPSSAEQEPWQPRCSHSQQPGITLHYTEHNDSQKRMIIGLTRGFSSLTHRSSVYIRVRTRICDCEFCNDSAFWCLLQKSKGCNFKVSKKALCTVQLATMRCVWTTRTLSSAHERNAIKKLSKKYNWRKRLADVFMRTGETAAAPHKVRIHRIGTQVNKNDKTRDGFSLPWQKNKTLDRQVCRA